jgi:hypothetical protein
MRLKSTTTNLLFRALLHVSAWLAKDERRQVWSRGFMQSLANKVVRRKGIHEVSELAKLGEQWQPAFPSEEDHPIISITESTVLAEIHTDCPLRGTGNAGACHRMMEFDRQIVGKAGGQFEVLESQAVTGGSFCRVAMKLKKPEEV